MKQRSMAGRHHTGKLRIVALLLALLIVSIAIASCKSDDKVTTVGILQLVQHESLDAAREGFIEGLKSAGYEVVD